MENGLIFPYRRRTASADPVMLPVPVPPPGSLRGTHRRKRARGDGSGEASALTDVTQEGNRAGRWQPRSKGVGRTVGKSAVHEPETRRDPLAGGSGDPMLPRKAS